MKKKLLSLLFIIAATASHAQTSPGIDAAFNACVSMQESLAKKDNSALKAAAQELAAAQTAPFSSLRCKDDSIASLNGHFVFDGDFAERVASGNDDNYAAADSIARRPNHRGQTATGAILTKTCLVKVGKSTKYSFVSRGKQELGIVTEPGGRVAVRIHATNRDGLSEWHNDNRNAKKGANRFRTSFNLPNDKPNRVELEVINRGKKNVSFVVISN